MTHPRADASGAPQVIPAGGPPHPPAPVNAATLARAVERMVPVLTLFETSPLHFMHPVTLLFDHLFPSLINDQYRLLYRGAAPASFVNWTWLSPEISARYAANGYILQPQDWNSGPELWFLEIVALPGMMMHLMRDLQKNVFAPGTRGRWLRSGPSGELRGIGEVRMPGRAPGTPQQQPGTPPAAQPASKAAR